MADVLNGLGSTPLYRIFPNWSNSPKYSFLNSLKILEYDGTPQNFYEVSTRKPQTFSCEMTLDGKQEEYNFLAFWKSRKGMVEKFWLPVYPEIFTLKRDILQSDPSIEVEPVPLEFNYERIYIFTKAEDLWTHKIDSYLTDETKTVLTLPSMAGKDIAINDINSFGLLLLCRFDKDTVDLKYKTDAVINVSLQVKEVMEYSEA